MTYINRKNTHIIVDHHIGLVTRFTFSTRHLTCVLVAVVIASHWFLFQNSIHSHSAPLPSRCMTIVYLVFYADWPLEYCPRPISNQLPLCCLIPQGLPRPPSHSVYIHFHLSNNSAYWLLCITMYRFILIFFTF